MIGVRFLVSPFELFAKWHALLRGSASWLFIETNVALENTIHALLYMFVLWSFFMRFCLYIYIFVTHLHGHVYVYI